MTAETQFRVGLVGAGGISEFHVRGLERSPHVRIVGICDLDQMRATALAKRFGLKAFATLGDMAQAGLDSVHVLTPPNSHAEVTLRALELGCHVFVEKPLATSVEDCDSIAEAAAQAGRVVGVNHSLLRDPFVERVIKIVHAGGIGDVVSVDYSKSQDYPTWREGPLPVPFRDGGYPFRDVGIHALYMIQELLGEPRHFEARYQAGAHPSLHFSEWRVIVECAQGLGQIHLSWNVRPMINVLTVMGTRGILRADLFGMTLSHKKVRPGPQFANRAINAWTEGASAAFQVPWNVSLVMLGRIRRFHGVQAMVAEFYERLAAGQGALVGPLQAKPVVYWNECIAAQADEAKLQFLSRFARTPTAPILVTGASGFIGRRLLARLLEQGERVRVLVRREPAPEIRDDSRIDVILGDLGDAEAVDRGVAGTRIVYHLGATMKGNADEAHRSTVLGTGHVIDSVLRQQVPKLVYVSSLSVLHATAARDASAVTEEWPLEPHPERRGSYTQSKLEAERLVSDAVRARGLHAVILRPGRVVGSGTSPITPGVARKKGNRLIILGDGQQVLPLVAVDDLIDGILAAVDRPVFDGSVLHLVDPTEVTQNDYVSQYINIKGDHLKMSHVPYVALWLMSLGFQTLFGLLRQPPPLSIYRLRSALSQLRFSCRKAEQQLGWRPRVGIRATLTEAFRAD